MNLLLVDCSQCGIGLVVVWRSLELRCRHRQARSPVEWMIDWDMRSPEYCRHCVFFGARYRREKMMTAAVYGCKCAVPHPGTRLGD